MLSATSVEGTRNDTFIEDPIIYRFPYPPSYAVKIVFKSFFFLGQLLHLSIMLRSSLTVETWIWLIPHHRSVHSLALVANEHIKIW